MSVMEIYNYTFFVFNYKTFLFFATCSKFRYIYL